jgi:signal transduction histidine kinase/putative methionine-R-sulfoxide reductase with GAF domain
VSHADPLAARLVGLSKILIGLAASPIPTHLLQTLAERAEAAVACEHLAICFKDAGGDAYVVQPLAGMAIERVWPRRVPITEGLPGTAMREARSIIVADLSEAEAPSVIERAWLEVGFRSILVVPVRSAGEPVGALVFARVAPASFGPDDREIASLLGAGLAGALDAAQSYQMMADERATLAAVVGCMQDAVLVVNPDGLVLLANPAVRGMLGVDPDIATGAMVGDVLPEAPLRVALETARPGTADVVLPDGRTAEASIVPVKTPYGESVGLAAILRDVSLLKQLSEMKNEFVNTVSHDLKNPLTIIMSAAELLAEELPPGSRAAARCEMISKAAAYMQGLVRDLLDLGKIEAGLEAPRDPVNVVPLVVEVLAMLEPEAAAKGVTLELAAPPDMHAMETGTAPRLSQALRNLVGNAVKYTPAGGRAAVTIQTDQRTSWPDTVHVVVSDTGFGIPAADLPYIFDKFYRVRSAATRSIEGTGLGLAIVKGIIDAHGGRIDVESREGHGHVQGVAAGKGR